MFFGQRLPYMRNRYFGLDLVTRLGLLDELLDDEAVRVISASPSWKPGTLNGKKVKASMSLYVEFRLEKR